MPMLARSRYWFCTLKEYPYPTQCPLTPSSFEFCAWKPDEHTLTLFVLYKSNRKFPSRQLNKWSPLPTPTTLLAYLENPLIDCLSLGKLPDAIVVKKKVYRSRKRKPPVSRAPADYVHLNDTDQHVHYNSLTGVTTDLSHAYGSMPPANASENLE